MESAKNHGGSNPHTQFAFRKLRAHLIRTIHEARFESRVYDTSDKVVGT
jgi:hypothetical protein